MEMQKYILTFIFLVLSMIGCDSTPRFRFQNTDSSITGIDFQNKIESTEKLNILNYLYFYNGAGVATADFNQDGLIDIYFTANTAADQLYLNQGNWVFKNSTELAGIDNATGWTNGVTQVDINQDGRLDLYIAKTGAYKHISGHNLLYINYGNNPDGIPQFKEESKKYGLDFVGFSTQTAFFDYDLDNDLDLFILNHSVHPNRHYGNGRKRNENDLFAGDKLFENKGGFFSDVTEKTGLYQGKIGYGLGVSVGDLNNDHYPDIYVGNDFFEHDYLYLNQQNGSFEEQNTKGQSLGHTTHFSMGNVFGDINNDGLADIISLDMLPEDVQTYKTSGGEYPYSIYQQFLKNGYQPQYMQNTLQLNRGAGNFSEIAFTSGIAATEWSWTPLLADFDNDGWEDLYVTNGILGATNDMDYINFISDVQVQKEIEKGMNAATLAWIDKIPTKKVPNYFFQNNRDLTFKDVTLSWNRSEPSYSNGAMYADFDNDGDLDLVINNINAPATLLENTTNNSNWVAFQFEGPEKNKNGIGTKVTLIGEKTTQTKELQITKGYLSAQSNRLYFGAPSQTTSYALEVKWPDGKTEKRQAISVGTLQTLKYVNASVEKEKKNKVDEIVFKSTKEKINFKHKEYPTLDFNRQPIIPFASSNEGPAIAVGDINQDGLDDLVITGAKKQASALFLQLPSGEFVKSQAALMEAHSLAEDTTVLLLDVDNDGDQDLIIGSGGNEFKSGDPLRPRLYRNEQGEFQQAEFFLGKLSLNCSVLSSADIDNDGDQDLLIGSDSSNASFANEGKQYLFENNGKGVFKDITVRFGKALEQVKHLKASQWIDIDQNGYLDLLAAGHWEPIRIFLNDGERLQRQEDNNLGNTHGWWNSITAADFDNDGDIDFVAGNWGTNSLFSATPEAPIRLYLADFDSNGTEDPLLTYIVHEKEIPFATKNQWSKQMPSINKKFLSYEAFAQASIEDIFGKKTLDAAIHKSVYEFRSSYFENKRGQFIKHALPQEAQIAPVNAMAVEDLNKDGLLDVILTGNNDYISTQLGRFDANKGTILLNRGQNRFTSNVSQHLSLEGMVQSINKITIDQHAGYVVGRNNDTPIFIDKVKEK